MEIRGSFGCGTTTAGTAWLQLPDGYSIDQSKQNTNDNGNSTCGYYIRGGGGAITYHGGGLMSNQGQTIYIYFDTASFSGGSFDPLTNSNADNIASSGEEINMMVTVPIQGWNANFNPLLSMPLVNIGRDSESLMLQDPAISTSATQRVHYITVLDDTDYSGDLFTYDNSTSQGLKITFNQNVDASVDFGAFATSNQWMAIAKNVDAGGTNAYSLNNTDVIAFGNTGYVNMATVPFSGKFQAGDYLYFHCPVNSTSADGNKVAFSISATKDRGNTNMAHIIKPAVAILSDHQAYNQLGGGSTAGFNDRTLNTVEGESWFVTLSSNQFTLEPGSYKISGQAPTFRVGAAHSRLYDVTNGVASILGYSDYTDTTGQTTVHSTFSGYVTIGASTIYKVQSYCQNAYSSSGLGYYNSPSTEDSIYTTITIEKLK
jgi:hypothetical protein